MDKKRAEEILLKRINIIESITNAIIGMCITFIAQLIIYPIVGLKVSLDQNLYILFLFTIISILRNYGIRSIFTIIKRKVKKDLKSRQ